jgi:hypothetical protein
MHPPNRVIFAEVHPLRAFDHPLRMTTRRDAVATMA